MAIAGLICRDCWKIVKASGEHWLEDCEDPTMHPGLVESYLEHAESHSELILTPTTILGKPRAEFIRRTMDYYPEAQGLNNMEVGSAVGDRAEKGMRRLGFESQLKLEGTILGYPMKGTGDFWWREKDGKMILRILGDNKFGGEKSFWYSHSRGRLAKNEESAQISMYVMMAKQMGVEINEEELDPVVWRGTIRAVRDYKTKRYLPNWMKCRAQFMNEEEIGALYPLGMTTTVRENADLLAGAFEAVKKGGDPREILKGIPLSCERIFGGSACVDYCGENRVCLGENGLEGADWARKKIVEVRLPQVEV